MKRRWNAQINQKTYRVMFPVNVLFHVNIPALINVESSALVSNVLSKLQKTWVVDSITLVVPVLKMCLSLFVQIHVPEYWHVAISALENALKNAASTRINAKRKWQRLSIVPENTPTKCFARTTHLKSHVKSAANGIWTVVTHVRDFVVNRVKTWSAGVELRKDIPVITRST